MNQATRNVSTLLDAQDELERPCQQTSLIAQERKRYTTAALSETWFSGEDSLTEVVKVTHYSGRVFQKMNGKLQELALL